MKLEILVTVMVTQSHIPKIHNFHLLTCLMLRMVQTPWPLQRPTYIWEDNIKTDLREKEYEDMNWVQLSQNTVQ